jgi:hypothetical protein
VEGNGEAYIGDIYMKGGTEENSEKPQSSYVKSI